MPFIIVQMIPDLGGFDLRFFFLLYNDVKVIEIQNAPQVTMGLHSDKPIVS